MTIKVGSLINVLTATLSIWLLVGSEWVVLPPEGQWAGAGEFFAVSSREYTYLVAKVLHDAT